MSNLFGIGLANGWQDIERVKSLGCGHYLALEGQADYLARCPGERHLRLWHKPGEDPVQVAERYRQYKHITRHLIPWNEPNFETSLSYPAIVYAFEWVKGIIDKDAILHWPGLAPIGDYRERADEWLPGAEMADIVDVHAYGGAAQILEIVDWYHSILPHKELLLTECNPGAGNVFNQDWWAQEYIALTTALLDRPWVIGAIGFIWEWHNPDIPLPTTVNWVGQPIERAVREAVKPERREWRREMEGKECKFEFGFKDLAAKYPVEVGKPVSELTPFTPAGDCMQFSENGLLVWSKQGNKNYFFRASRVL